VTRRNKKNKKKRKDKHDEIMRYNDFDDNDISYTDSEQLDNDPSNTIDEKEHRVKFTLSKLIKQRPIHTN
jgi:hypothetical protein